MKLISTVLLVSALMFGGVGCVSAQESPLVGNPAPDFTLARLSGKSESLSGQIKGKKAILFFFATWCPHCREQIDFLAPRQEELAARGVVLVLVDIGESRSKVTEFLAAHEIKNDAFLDEDAFVSGTYQIMGVPTLVFVGDDGKVRLVEYGLPDNYEEILN